MKKIRLTWSNEYDQFLVDDPDLQFGQIWFAGDYEGEYVSLEEFERIKSIANFLLRVNRDQMRDVLNYVEREGLEYRTEEDRKLMRELVETEELL